MLLTQICIENFYINISVLEEKFYKDNIPKLTCINWSTKNDISLKNSICKQFKTIYNLDTNPIKFIDKNRLDSKQLAQNLLLSTIKQLNEYFTKKRLNFTLPIDLQIGTKFQKTVWLELQKIEYGKTISYKKLAQNINKPNAYRAAANANGKNPISIIIPCHRVISNDKTLGGYTGGLDKKIFLLSIEQVGINQKLNTKF